MKTIISIISVIILSSGLLIAQEGYELVLAEILKNNTSLEAYRQQAKADKLDSKVGIYLQNPEIGFNYLWGSPAEIHNRTDINVMQSFDFPTSYSHRKKISDIRASQVDMAYMNELALIKYETRLVCIDLVYYAALIKENKKRLEYAESIAEAITAMYEQGKENILEKNKAQLNYASASSEHMLLIADMNNLMADLKRLNGGKEIDFPYTEYPAVHFPDEYDEWFRQMETDNPYFLYLNAQVSISEKEEKLIRAMSLPRLSAGYMSEKVGGEQHQGLSVGMSIPLWENKNSVKAARAQTAANLAVVEDSRLQVYTRLSANFERVKHLQKAVDSYSSALIGSNNTDLLKKAYDLGEISLIEYLVEVQFYFDTMVKSLEAQREMQKAIAELQKWE